MPELIVRMRSTNSGPTGGDRTLARGQERDWSDDPGRLPDLGKNVRQVTGRVPEVVEYRHPLVSAPGHNPAIARYTLPPARASS